MTSTPGGIGRRERFILAIALGGGLGVTLVPEWTQNNLWPETDSMSSGLKGFRDAIIITLSTGYRCARDVSTAHVHSGGAEPDSELRITMVSFRGTKMGYPDLPPPYKSPVVSLAQQLQSSAQHDVCLCCGQTRSDAPTLRCVCSLGVLLALTLNLILPNEAAAEPHASELDTTHHDDSAHKNGNLPVSPHKHAVEMLPPPPSHMHAHPTEV